MSQTEAKNAKIVAGILVVFVVVMGWMIANIPARPAYGQWMTSGSSEAVESSAKPSQFTGTWVRTTDQREFTANVTTGKWLGTERIFSFAKTGTGVTGALNMDGAIPCDTTDVAQDGYVMSDSSYITAITCTNDNGVTVNDSLELFVNSTRIYAAAWTGTTEFLTPSALVWPANSRLACFIKSGAQNPSRPLVRVTARPFVSQ